MTKQRIIQEMKDWALGLFFALLFLVLFGGLVYLDHKLPHQHGADCYNYGHLSCEQADKERGLLP